MVDAALLFGCFINGSGRRQMRLQVEMHRSRWPALGWMYGALVANGIELIPYGKEEDYGRSLTMLSDPMCWLGKVRSRWYPSGRREVPKGIELDEAKVAAFFMGHQEQVPRGRINIPAQDGVHFARSLERYIGWADWVNGKVLFNPQDVSDFLAPISSRFFWLPRESA